MCLCLPLSVTHLKFIKIFWPSPFPYFFNHRQIYNTILLYFMLHILISTNWMCMWLCNSQGMEHRLGHYLLSFLYLVNLRLGVIKQLPYVRLDNERSLTSISRVSSLCLHHICDVILNLLMNFSKRKRFLHLKKL